MVNILPEYDVTMLMHIQLLVEGSALADQSSYIPPVSHICCLLYSLIVYTST